MLCGILGSVQSLCDIVYISLIILLTCSQPVALAASSITGQKRLCVCVLTRVAQIITTNVVKYNVFIAQGTCWWVQVLFISPEINFLLRPCVRCQNLQLVCRHTGITITVGKSIITASDDDGDEDDDGD